MAVQKKGAVAVRRTSAQKAAATKAAKREADQALAKAEAQRLAQIANLLIGGYSLADIGAQIGASADEVDRMLNRDMARYVRNQPALRVFVRNFISEKYLGLLDAVYEEATDRNHPDKIENSMMAVRILERMGRLHGAEAPTQSEVKVDAAPEVVDRMVAQLAAGNGLGYDVAIFDSVPGEVVHEAHTQAQERLLDAAEMVGEDDEHDEPF